jgi:hypothetical protein
VHPSREQHDENFDEENHRDDEASGASAACVGGNSLDIVEIDQVLILQELIQRIQTLAGWDIAISIVIDSTVF